MVKTVEEFNNDCQEYFTKLVKWQDFWRSAIEHDVDIPYDAASSIWNHHVNIAQYQDYDPETNLNPLNVEATRVAFARVVKWAKANGWKIEKKYKDDEFSIRVSDIPEPISYVEFYSTRQVVCQRIEVGTKHVEAHEEPIYEYQCDKVAFLSVEV